MYILTSSAEGQSQLHDKQTVMNELTRLLSVHNVIEETVLYPAIEKHMKDLSYVLLHVIRQTHA